MEKLISEITTATNNELKSANEKFPMFHSQHEAYGVIAVKMKEFLEDAKIVTDILNSYFGNVCNNEYVAQQKRLVLLRDNAIHTAAEACQVAAMAQKGLDSLNYEQLGKSE